MGKLSYLLTLSVILLMVLGAIIPSIVVNYTSAKTGSSKWTTYNDPYNRYTIKYPSKLTVETEPVHDGSYEVLLKVTGHGSVLIIRDMGSMNNLSLHEYASYYRSNEDQGTVVKSYPIVCGFFAAQSNVMTCSYNYITTVGLIPIGTRVDLFSYADKVFAVTFIFNSEGTAANNMESIFHSFRLNNADKSSSVNLAETPLLCIVQFSDNCRG